jgi:hypothetical protein
VLAAREPLEQRLRPAHVVRRVFHDRVLQALLLLCFGQLLGARAVEIVGVDRVARGRGWLVAAGPSRLTRRRDPQHHAQHGSREQQRAMARGRPLRGAPSEAEQAVVERREIEIVGGRDVGAHEALGVRLRVEVFVGVRGAELLDDVLSGARHAIG